MAEEHEEVGVALRADDPYERDYMTPEDGEVLYRDKFIASWPWHAIMGAATLITVAAMALPTASGAPTPAWLWPLTILPMLALWILFAVIRVTVTTRHVHVQMGPFGPKIAIEDIESVESVDYDWKEYGGWGIRYRPGKGMAYNMMGDGGEGVKINRRTASGKLRHVLVSSAQAPLIVDAVQRAMAMSGASQGADDAAEEVTLGFDEGQDEAQDAEVTEQVEAGG
jgi:hypothetical protein